MVSSVLRIYEKEEALAARSRLPQSSQPEEQLPSEDGTQQMGVGFEKFEGRQQNRNRATSKSLKTILSRSRPVKGQS